MKLRNINILLIGIILFSIGNIFAQEKEENFETDVISLVGRKGLQFKSKTGDFVLNPYMLILARGQFNYVDDEGLNLADPDNIINTGFGIPNAILGFAGKAFKNVYYNFAVDVGKAGKPSLLNQAWFDILIKPEFRIKVGKFKTPMNRAYLVRLGQTLFPVVPASLNTRMNIPYSLNAANPVFATGFDIGVQLHGLIDNKLQYQAGVFNGTGININMPKNTTSDDNGIPSLLYAGRLAYMPFGPMPLHEGDPNDVNNVKLMIAASTSYNVEANNESTDDFRFGGEFALLYKRWYLSSEFYYMNVDFVEKQQREPKMNFWGSYIQAGYLLECGLQPIARFEMFDRNSTDDDGLLYLTSVGFNYFITGQNLKVQVMYQNLSRSGHATQLKADDDDNGLSEHSAVVQLQFSF